MELYYYTTVQTMQYILQGGNIYATNLRYMNDAEEYNNGLQELSFIFNEKTGNKIISDEMVQEELIREVSSYSISFSKARDLLSQWSMYAGESGASIKLHFTGKERFKAYPDTGMGDKKERDYLSDTGGKFTVQKVHYCTRDAMTDEDYQQAAEDIWNQILKDENPVTKGDISGNIIKIWKSMAPYVKRVEFRAEAEYRLIFESAQWKCPFLVEYRNSHNVLKPYLDVECEGGWPIQEIIIGPGFNQDVVFNSVMHLLNNRRLKVPELDGIQFQQRCEEYFKACGELPDDAQKIWDEGCAGLMENSGLRYSIFLDMRNRMCSSSVADVQYREQLKRRELTRSGIILSRSRIPYIFQN